jgi:hypothetical protein
MTKFEQRLVAQKATATIKVVDTARKAAENATKVA